MIKLISFLILIVIALPSQGKALKAHHHGHAKLDIAADEASKSIMIMFETASEGVLGFEHSPTTKNEKEDFKKVKALWTNQLVSLFLIDPKWQCSATSSSLNLEAEEEEHSGHKDEKAKRGQHSEIKAEASFNCKKAPLNGKISLLLLDSLNQLKLTHRHLLQEIEVSVLPAKKIPYKRELKKGKIEIEL